ncbi:MAG: NADH-quinone oxidoreductase subunit C [Chloroflexota bacterium]|nr:NADH-quinone oxidoreductase subunit C [Chloroflexota bacterium]
MTQAKLSETLDKYGDRLWPLLPNEWHYRLKNSIHILELSKELKKRNFYLVTVIANDERELEDKCFKIYYLFSHPADNMFLITEMVLDNKQETYCSIAEVFKAARPFELEIGDLFGLYPAQRLGQEQSARPAEDRTKTFLHGSYPANFNPLRRHDNALLPETTERVTARYVEHSLPEPPTGELYLTVGPVHAGVIEPGRFSFRISGEIIEEVEIKLGYTHKGIERLFQTHYNLLEGWRLAEHVSGDSSFAHSLAYCKAVEALAGCHISKVAKLLRALFLEMERLVNHIGDTGALAHDIALELVAAELAVLREEMLRLNGEMTGSRFLRKLNRPGGLELPGTITGGFLENLWIRLEKITNKYQALAEPMLKGSHFRNRALGVGILKEEQALDLGATGMVARAAGLLRDFRLQHPFGPYGDAEVKAIIESHRGRYIENYGLDKYRGDVYSRFLQRMEEVETSKELIAYFIQCFKKFPPVTNYREELDLERVDNFVFGFGYVEGWRGDIVYWIMKDKFNRIYRCKIRDASTLNWPALKEALAPTNSSLRETLLADFPLINKSFNLSYSGNDL